MKWLKLLLFVSLFILLNSTLFAQDLRDRSDHVLILSHSTDNYKKLLKNPELINSSDFQSGSKIWIDVDSADSYFLESLAPGNYTFLKLNQNRLEVEFRTKSNLLVALQSFGKVPGIRIWDQQGNPVTDADVFLKRKRLKYNEKVQAYLIRSHTRKGEVRIIRNEVSDFHCLTYRKPYQSSYDGYFFSGDDCIAPGFVVTNQPLYRHNDTLKVKVYLTNCDGKPISSNAEIELLYGKKVIHNEILEPVSPGAFLFNMLLPDTLKLDAEYSITAKPVGSTIYYLKKQNTFRMEDYELKEAVMDLTPLRTHFTLDQQVLLKFTAHDQNGLSLIDAEAEVVLLTHGIRNTYSNLVTIPDTLFKNVFKMDETGEMMLTIPDSSIRYPLDYSIRGIVFLRSSSNELVQKNFIINLDYKKLNFRVDVISDSLHLVPLNDFADTVQMLTKGKDWIRQKTHTLPAVIKVNPVVNSYHFNSNDQVENVFLSSISHQVKIFSKTEKDSIELEIYNPYNLQLLVRANQGSNQTFFADSATSRIFKVKKDEKLTMHLHFLWGGDAVHLFSDFQLFDKRLYIETNLPDVVYPSANNEIEIIVSDYMGKPEPDVNLTILGINNQFRTQNIPHLSYYGSTVPPTKLPAGQKLNKKQCNVSFPATPYWVKIFELQNSYFYKSLFADESGFQTDFYIDTSSPAQLAVYPVKNNRFIKPLWIEIDGKPSWFHELETSYSIVTSQGLHRVRVRLADAEYILDSICADRGHKTIFAFNLDSLPKNVRLIKKPTSFSAEEINKINRNFITIQSEIWSGRVLIENGRIYNFYDLPNRMQKRWIGPLVVGQNVKVNFNADGYLEFPHEIGLNHNLKKGIVVAKEDLDFQKKNLRNKVFTISLTDAAPGVNDYYKFFKQPLIRINPKLFSDLPTRTIDVQEAGKLRVLLLPQVKVNATSIVSFADKSRTRFYKGKVTFFPHLPEGRYQVQYYTDSLILQIPEVIISPDTTTIISGELISVVIDTMVGSINLESGEQRVEEMNFQYSQSSLNEASIIGRVLDADGEGAISANVVVTKNDKVISGAATDFDGNFVINSVEAGLYDIKISYLGHITKNIKSVQLKSYQALLLNIELELREEFLDVVEIMNYRSPLINKGIAQMPSRSVQGVTASSASVNIRGGREDATDYYVDGVRVRGSVSYPMDAANDYKLTAGSANFGLTGKDISDKEEIPMEASGIRTRFSNNAIWEPNLLTNSEGKANFSVTWPDDITRWKTTVLAINSELKTGTSTTFTKAFKPLQAQLSVPRFLVEGDSSQAYGRVMNYTGSEYPLQASFKGLTTATYDTTVSASAAWDYPIYASGTDSVHTTFSLKLKNGYTDGETRGIPVFPAGMHRHEGQFFMVSRDTTLQITPADPAFPVEVMVTNQLNEVLRDEIEFLRRFPHACNEQLASQLHALLTAKILTDEDEWKRRDERLIRRLISRLEQNQNREGGWGWWGKSKSNAFMTLKVAEALLIAKDNGFKVNSMEKFSVSVEKMFQQFDKKDDQIHLLLLGAITNADLNYDYLLNLHETDTSNEAYHHLTLLRVKQLIKKPYNPYQSLLYTKKSIYGNFYAGDEYSRNLYKNSLYSTALCYEVLRDANFSRDTLDRFLGYLFENRSGNHYRNTIISAKMIRLLAEEFKKRNASQTEIRLVYGDNNSSSTSMPFSSTIAAHTSATLEVKTDGPTYITTFQSFFDASPPAKKEYFTVESHWIQKDRKVEMLEAGYAATLKINVKVKNRSEYVMLEVPVPGGSSYEKDIRNKHETHREYFREKVAIYFEFLPEGEYDFEVKIVPRFTGSYTLNPARIENMYFPVFEGNNLMKRVKVVKGVR